MRPARRTAGAAGFSLAELLVALVVAALTVTVALAAYAAARRTLERGAAAAHGQRGLRAAAERLRADLRLAGQHLDPDGDARRPDEAVEAALATAIVVRADFDGADPGRSTDPEAVLAGDAFRAVSTGNDEIVGYVLARADGSSTQTLSFDADVAEPRRDGDVETVHVEGVSLAQDDPPYTLYRFTLSNDPGRWGRRGFVVRRPVADGVRSLRFRYLDRNGAPLGPPRGGTGGVGGADEPASRAWRAAIHRIDFEIEAVSPGARAAGTSRTAGRAGERRGFRLAGVVTPRAAGGAGR